MTLQCYLYNPHDTRRYGFTLIELLVVLTILGMLAAIATPRVTKHLTRAKAQSAKIEIKNISMSLEIFRTDIGRYPTQGEGLNALQKKTESISSSWNGPYLDKKNEIKDPWGMPYIYIAPGQHGDYDLLSYGADHKEGGQDENEDITNW